jgi:subtilisin family serine protease
MKCRAAAGATAALALLVAVAAPALAATSYPDDYFFAAGDQWALNGSGASINAPAAWCASSGAGIVVADVDTGGNFGHPDLSGKLIAGAQFLGGSTTESSPSGTGQAAVSDDNGHGSMTTGIMVADTGNGRGLAAVAPSARALIVKVLDSTGSGWDTDIGNGIRWAVDYGHANVVNLSIGPGDVTIHDKSTGIAPPTPGGPIVQAIQYAASKGVAVALAAGNSAIPSAGFVSLTQNLQALVVGALGPDDTVAGYSNYGYGVGIYAPGGWVPSGTKQSLQNEIVSTYQPNEAYAIGEGTSFAAPQVAGALALLMATGMSAQQAIDRITATASTSADGVPQLNAAAALGRSKADLCGTPSSGGSVPPPAVIGSGGTRISVATPTPRPAAPPPTAQRTAPPASTAAGTVPTAGAGVVQTPGSGDVHGSGAVAPAGPHGGSGGAPSPAVIAGLAVLLGGGAPAAIAVRRRLRRGLPVRHDSRP